MITKAVQGFYLEGFRVGSVDGAGVVFSFFLCG